MVAPQRQSSQTDTTTLQVRVSLSLSLDLSLPPSPDPVHGCLWCSCSPWSGVHLRHLHAGLCLQGRLPHTHTTWFSSDVFLQAMCGLQCGHFFCQECWNSYLKVMVMCEGRSQSIQCPASHCSIVVDEATVLQLLREPEVSFSTATPSSVRLPIPGPQEVPVAHHQQLCPGPPSPPLVPCPRLLPCSPLHQR